MHIRHLMPAQNPDDLTLLQRDYTTMLNDPADLLYLSFAQTPFTKEITDDWFLNHKRDRIEYYAMIEDEHVLAVAVTQLVQAQHFKLLGFVVRRDLRERGLGRAMIEHVNEEARRQGFKAVEVDTYADNRRMQRLLLSLDFRPVSMTPNVRLDGMDMVHLRRVL
ncbi:MAG TPA: GNAT family N-acetyltransferase [bacterium]|mgnify:FL=1|nr:GNAT family N-acetyltransferase [bacterium]